MKIFPYQGIQNLEDFIQGDFPLPMIPLTQIVVQKSQLPSLSPEEKKVQLSQFFKLQDSNTCWCYVFFPIVYGFIQLARATYGILAALIGGVLWFISLFFFLIASCCIITNQPMNRYTLMMRIHYFSILIDFGGLLYTGIYLIINIDSGFTECKGSKINGVCPEDQVQFYPNSYSLVWIGFASLIAYSLQAAILCCLNNKLPQQQQYIPISATQRTQV